MTSDYNYNFHCEDKIDIQRPQIKFSTDTS